MTGLLGRPERSRSLRWRLLFAVCIVVLLVWILGGILSYGKARHEAEELMDGNLAQRAHLLMALLRDNEDHFDDIAMRLAVVGGKPYDVYEPPLEFQFGREDGTILLRSTDAPSLPITGLPGYSDILRQNESWRVLNVVSTDQKYRIQVAQDIDVRDRAALEVATQTVLPVGLILPALLLLLYVSIRRGLRPLDRLTDAIATRSSDNLAPLPNSRVPTEARPLVAALNRLFFRVGATIENERRFTADAAHELRTPLAALKIQAQVALMSPDPQARDHALKQITSGVDRATHLVEQLLRLARLDPLSSLPAPTKIDLCAVVNESVAAIRSPRASLTQRIFVELPSGELPVTADAGLLAIALRNLLDNAIRYTPATSSIWVSALLDGRNVVLTVRDDGPGVPATEQSRLGERFFRSHNAVAEGTGLGLAIVARIAELHGGQFAASNGPSGGFEARITFPGSLIFRLDDAGSSGLVA